MTLISIVITFRNEEDVLPFTLERLEQVVLRQKEEFELILVDDSSSDQSLEVIRQQVKKIKKLKIRVLQTSRRFGVEECFLAGIENAKGEAIILMYADLQDPPELIPKLIESWRNGNEIVHTIRRRRIKEKFSKVILSSVAYRLISNCSDFEIPPDAGEFKLISRRIAQYLLLCREHNPYLRGLIPWFGFKQDKILYDLQPRAKGRSKIPLFGEKALTVFLSAIVSFTPKPIFFILKFSIIGTVISYFLFFLALIGMNISLSPELKMIILILLILWFQLVFLLGFLGFYLFKIYMNILDRPRFIIKQVIELK